MDRPSPETDDSHEILSRRVHPSRTAASTRAGRPRRDLQPPLRVGDTHAAGFWSQFVDGLATLLRHSSQFAELKPRLYEREWVVYAKQPFGGPAQVFHYLGRYTHRVGLSNHRLVSFDGHEVCFRTKHGKTCTIDAVEFIRRFLLHVLPARFVKIRHYGLVAAANVGTKLETARRCLLASENDCLPVTNPELPSSWQDLFRALTGIDLLVCPSCGARSVQSYPFTPGTSHAGRRDTS
jgi:hypothetical protein